MSKSKNLGGSEFFWPQKFLGMILGFDFMDLDLIFHEIKTMQLLGYPHDELETSIFLGFSKSDLVKRKNPDPTVRLLQRHVG